jgi:hypothetical protein
MHAVGAKVNDSHLVNFVGLAGILEHNCIRGLQWCQLLAIATMILLTVVDCKSR